ncbi:hypothetical protein [Sporomusa aerivorans]
MKLILLSEKPVLFLMTVIFTARLRGKPNAAKAGSIGIYILAYNPT